MAHEMSQSPYPGRAMYPPYHDSGQQGDSMFSYQQHMRSLGYPFHMNSMSPSGYQHPVGQTFSMPHYEQSPSPPRDGKFMYCIRYQVKQSPSPPRDGKFIYCIKYQMKQIPSPPGYGKFVCCYIMSNKALVRQEMVSLCAV